MNRKLYKALWSLRFEKMLSLEQKGAFDYQLLLDECPEEYCRTYLPNYLKELIVDEQKHTRLVEELVKIAHRQN